MRCAISDLADILDYYMGAHVTFTYGYRSICEARILSFGTCYANDLSGNLIYSNGTCQRVATLAQRNMLERAGYWDEQLTRGDNRKSETRNPGRIGRFWPKEETVLLCTHVLLFTSEERAFLCHLVH